MVMTIYVTYEPSTIYKGSRPLNDDDYLLGLTVGQLLGDNGWLKVTAVGPGNTVMTFTKTKPVTEANVLALHRAKCEAQGAADKADKAYRDAARALQAR